MDDHKELPKIISVDDHVVEPPHVWQEYLPEKYREKGPRVIRERFGAISQRDGAKYNTPLDPEGETSTGPKPYIIEVPVFGV